MKLGKIAFRNIFRNRRRSILSGTAIMVAAMSIVMLFSLLAGMTEDMEYNLHTYTTEPSGSGTKILRKTSA